MTIDTPVGTCIFESEESCCNQLGYEYVSDNIGKTNDVPLGGLIDPTIPVILGSICCCFIGVVIILLLVLILRKKKA